jgi:hypothetical protein
MQAYSDLLNTAIDSMLAEKEDQEMNMLFSDSAHSAFGAEVSGLDDFELVAFLVIEEAASC